MSERIAPTSLRRRALIAFVLLIGFYLLAIVIAVALIALPVLDYAYLHRVHPQLLIACGVAALAIFSALVPRSDHFEAPGPELREADQPRLFGMLRDIATKAEERMPQRV